MPEEIKEKLEFLKREEIKTMAKDIARLQEEEARKERERIAVLKTEEETGIEREKVERIKREAEERKKLEEEVKQKAEVLKEKIKPAVVMPEAPEIEKEAKEILTPKPLPRKPSRFEKVFIRVTLVIILLLIFANLFLFWYWYLRVENPLPLFPLK